MRQRTLLCLRQRTPSHAKERAHRACTINSSVLVVFDPIQDVCVCECAWGPRVGGILERDDYVKKGRPSWEFALRIMRQELGSMKTPFGAFWGQCWALAFG